MGYSDRCSELKNIPDIGVSGSSHLRAKSCEFNTSCFVHAFNEGCIPFRGRALATTPQEPHGSMEDL